MELIAATAGGIIGFIVWVGVAVGAVIGGLLWHRAYRRKQANMGQDDDLTI